MRFFNFPYPDPQITKIQNEINKSIKETRNTIEFVKQCLRGENKWK